jgi:hypothetical protein
MPPGAAGWRGANTLALAIVLMIVASDRSRVSLALQSTWCNRTAATAGNRPHYGAPDPLASLDCRPDRSQPQARNQASRGTVTAPHADGGNSGNKHPKTRAGTGFAANRASGNRAVTDRQQSGNNLYEKSSFSQKVFAALPAGFPCSCPLIDTRRPGLGTAAAPRLPHPFDRLPTAAEKCRAIGLSLAPPPRRPQGLQP